MKLIATLLLTTLAGVAVAAPQKEADSARYFAASPHAAMPPGHPPAIPADTNLVNSGKVLEVIQSPTYTYLRVFGKKAPVWLAVYKIDIAKGTVVNYSDGVVMSDFHSKSLNRTFDTIIFVDSVVPKKK